MCVACALISIQQFNKWEREAAVPLSVSSYRLKIICSVTQSKIVIQHQEVQRSNVFLKTQCFPFGLCGSVISKKERQRNEGRKKYNEKILQHNRKWINRQEHLVIFAFISRTNRNEVISCYLPQQHFEWILTFDKRETLRHNWNAGLWNMAFMN